MCEEAGWAETNEEGWILSDGAELPPVEDLLESLLAEEPRWSADCILLNHAIGQLPALLKSMPTVQADIATQSGLYTASMLEQMATSSPIAHAHISSILARVEKLLSIWPENAPLRILELGVGGAGLTRQLQSMLAVHGGHLTAIDSNKLAIDRLRILLAEHGNFEAIHLDESFEIFDELAEFDLVVSANGLQFISNAEIASAKIAPAPRTWRHACIIHRTSACGP